MTSRKKLIISIIALSIIVFLALATMIVVLVLTNQTAGSVVNVKYKSQDVYVEIQANAYIGDDTYAFVDGNNNTSINLTPYSSEGSLMQPNGINNDGSIPLDKVNDTAILEYIFINKDTTGNTDAKISLTELNETLTSFDNVDVKYVFSSTQETNIAILQSRATDTYETQLLPAYDGQETRMYIYIIASISDVLEDASMVGPVNWNLLRAENTEVTTYTLNLDGAELMERVSAGTSVQASTTTQIKTLSGATTVNLNDVVPVKANNTFLGWTDQEGSTEVISSINQTSAISNAIRGTGAVDYYPVYKVGTVPASSYVYNAATSTTEAYYSIAQSTITDSIPDFVIPDAYNDGTNGLAKVTIVGGTEDNAGILQNNASVTSITIGRNVTSLGNKSFYNCSNVTELNYYPTLLTERLGENVFLKMGSATSGVTLNIGPNVQQIRFYFSTSIVYDDNLIYPNIKVVNFAEGSVCSKIDSHAFWILPNLTTIAIPDSVVEMGSSIFHGCESLTNVVLSKNIKKLSDRLFYLCTSLTSITIPENVESIGYECFYKTKISSIQFPAKLKEISHNIFKDCTTIKDIVIPKSVININYRAFNNCPSITSMVVEQGNPKYDSRNNCNAIIETDTNILVAGCQNTVIPSTIEVIGRNAFYYCTSLTSVNLPEGLKSIERNAFYGCNKLTRYNIPDSVNYIGSSAAPNNSSLYFSSINNYVKTDIGELRSVTYQSYNFYINGKALSTITTITKSDLEGVTAICDYAFYDLTNLTSVTLPNTLKTVGEYAFRNTGLTSINIPDSVVSIGCECFALCTNLSSITLGQSLETIGDYAFCGCAVNTIILPSKLVEIGYSAFGDTNITQLYIPNSVTFFGGGGTSDLTSLEFEDTSSKWECFDIINEINIYIDPSTMTTAEMADMYESYVPGDYMGWTKI